MPRLRLSELTDNELVPECLAQHGEAWEELVRRHRRRVFNIAYQFVGRFDEAEDLVQDLFIKIHGALDRYDTSRNFVFWLNKITRNLCIDHFRQRRREHELFTEGDDAMKMLESTGLDAYALVRRKERVDFLRRGLDQLAPDLRTSVILRDLHEYSYREIADELGIPEGTVKSRINRGRTELTRILQELETEEQLIKERTVNRSQRRRPGRSRA